MKTTTFYLPEAAEALLHETIRATVTDARVVSVACLNAPTVARGREEHESDVEYASRAWTYLLPGKNSALLEFRREFGWTEAEVRQIMHLLAEAQAECRGLILNTMLEGTRATLSEQVKRLDKLVHEWREVIP